MTERLGSILSLAPSWSTPSFLALNALRSIDRGDVLTSCSAAGGLTRPYGPGYRRLRVDDPAGAPKGHAATNLNRSCGSSAHGRPSRLYPEPRAFAVDSLVTSFEYCFEFGQRRILAFVSTPGVSFSLRTGLSSTSCRRPCGRPTGVLLRLLPRRFPGVLSMTLWVLERLF